LRERDYQSSSVVMAMVTQELLDRLKEKSHEEEGKSLSCSASRKKSLLAI